MLKKPLSVSIFLVLFIGLSDYGYGCHEGEKHKFPNAPCGEPTGGQDTRGGEVGEYDVTFEGAVMGSGADWLGGGPEKTIRYNAFDPDASFLHLDFFNAQFPSGPFTDGDICFGSLNFPLDFTGHIRQGRGGRAEAQFFFEGRTEQGGQVEVGYNFQMFGLFLGDWPVPSGGATTLRMTAWKMGVSNEGEDVTNIS